MIYQFICIRTTCGRYLATSFHIWFRFRKNAQGTGNSSCFWKGNWVAIRVRREKLFTKYTFVLFAVLLVQPAQYILLHILCGGNVFKQDSNIHGRNGVFQSCSSQMHTVQEPRCPGFHLTEPWGPKNGYQIPGTSRREQRMLEISSKFLAMWKCLHFCSRCGLDEIPESQCFPKRFPLYTGLVKFSMKK